MNSAYAFELFKNVKQKNIAINNFLLSGKTLPTDERRSGMGICSALPEGRIFHKQNAVSVCFCHINSSNIYSPALIGMDYSYLMEYGVYRQTLTKL
jgi:hypothetical protein